MSLFIPSTFRYEQITPSSVWTIVHNLGNNGSQGVPIVDVFVNKDGNLAKIMPSKILIQDNNTVVIEFDVGAFTGVAHIIV
jgi:hypothetical protein